jgi:hypothetical protein
MYQRGRENTRTSKRSRSPPERSSSQRGAILMVLITDGRKNSVDIRNGFNLEDLGIIVRASTVCTGDYTDFEIHVPTNAEITRGKKKLAKSNLPIKVRIYREKVSE